MTTKTKQKTKMVFKTKNKQFKSCVFLGNSLGLVDFQSSFDF